MDLMYQAFLAHVFDHPESEEAWFWDVDAPTFDEKPETLAKLVSLTFQRSGTDLVKFSDHQVNDGLKYILDGACNDMFGIIRDSNFPLEIKLDVIRSMQSLYSDCLALRCPPVLGHISEASTSPLNYICYMLWDVTPLAYWPGEGKDAAYSEILRVLEYALYLRNDACIESALHGLGHMHYKCPEKVKAVIQNFIDRGQGLRAELHDYAKAAQSGYVL